MKPVFRPKRMTPIAALALIALSLPGCVVVPVGPPRHAYAGPPDVVVVRPYHRPYYPYRGYYRDYRD